MKITTRIFQIFGIIGYIIPLAAFLSSLFFFIATQGILQGSFLALLVWSLYILCIPSHHGGSTLEPLLESFFSITWCTSPLMWLCAAGLNALTVFLSHSIYFETMPTHLLYHIITKPSPGWFIVFASALGTLYPWIIGQDAWHKPRYHHLLIYYFLKLFGIYVFLKFAYPQWVIIMNLVGCR